MSQSQNYTYQSINQNDRGGSSNINDNLKEKINFGLVSCSFQILGILCGIADFAYDAYVAFKFFQKENVLHFWLSIIFGILPAYAISLLSFITYLMNDKKKLTNWTIACDTKACWALFRCTFHVIPLAPAVRAIDLLRHGRKCETYKNKNEIHNLIRLSHQLKSEDCLVTFFYQLENYLEAAPQLLLKINRIATLYLSKEISYSDEWDDSAGIVIGMMAFAWRQVGYKKTCNLSNDNERSMKKSHISLLLITNVIGVFARFLPLGLFSAMYPLAFGTFSVIHTLFSLWFVQYYYSRVRVERRCAVFSWNEARWNPLKDVFVQLFLAVSHYFAFLDFRMNDNYWHHFNFSLVSLFESVPILLIWEKKFSKFDDLTYSAIITPLSGTILLCQYLMIFCSWLFLRKNKRNSEIQNVTDFDLGMPPNDPPLIPNDDFHSIYDIETGQEADNGGTLVEDSSSNTRSLRTGDQYDQQSAPSTKVIPEVPSSEIENLLSSVIRRRRPWAQEETIIIVGKLSFNASSVIGRGAFGAVFEGFVSDYPKKVAVKRLQRNDRIIDDSDNWQEVEILKKAHGHTNILRFICTEQSDDFLFIVTELCIGTLDGYVNWIYQGPRFRDEKEILQQLTQGLAHLHGLNIVHRDIKPLNILITIEGDVGIPTVKIADFGISKILKSGIHSDLGPINVLETDREDFTNTSWMNPRGTRGWMAPELYESHRYDLKVDIWGLGLIFGYTLSGGKHPYGDYLMECDHRIRQKYPMVLVQEDLKWAYSKDQLAMSLIKSMLEINPDMRPTADDLLKSDFFLSCSGEKVQIMMQTIQC